MIKLACAPTRMKPETPRPSVPGVIRLLKIQNEKTWIAFDEEGYFFEENAAHSGFVRSPRRPPRTC